MVGLFLKLEFLFPPSKKPLRKNSALPSVSSPKLQDLLTVRYLSFLWPRPDSVPPGRVSAGHEVPLARVPEPPCAQRAGPWPLAPPEPRMGRVSTEQGLAQWADP